MPRKSDRTKTHDYLERAKKLRSLGYNIKYSPSRKSTKTPQYKSAVSRLWERAKNYVNVPNQVFHRYRSETTRKRWQGSGAISRSQDFPGGFFQELPPGYKKGEYQLRLREKGEVELKVRRKNKRIVDDRIIPLDATALATDSKAELELKLKGKKRPRKFLLRCNGHSRRADRHPDGGFNDLETFNRYIEDDLIPQLNDAEFDYEKWGKEVFGFILQYTPKGRKKAEGEGETFNFKTGSIFDAKSKRVYGRKKFLNRKKYKKKKGKRKGT